MDEHCKHENMVIENGENCCGNCGEIIDFLDFKAEWRGGESNSRCQFISSGIEKNNLETIFNSLQISLTSAQKKEIKKRYETIVEEKTLRGNTRKSIVAACVMFSFRNEGVIITQEQLCRIFNLTRTQVSEGISKHTKMFPESRIQNIKDCDVITSQIDKCKEKFGVNIDSEKIVSYYNTLIKKDRNFKHSNPKNAASALILLFLQKIIGLKIPKSEFSSKMEQAEAGITKLLKIAQRIIVD